MQHDHCLGIGSEESEDKKKQFETVIKLIYDAEQKMIVPTINRQEKLSSLSCFSTSTEICSRHSRKEKQYLFNVSSVCSISIHTDIQFSNCIDCLQTRQTNKQDSQSFRYKLRNLNCSQGANVGQLVSGVQVN
jgi:hypothetical protein